MTVPAATGNPDFSIPRSNTQQGAKQLTDTTENTIKCFFVDDRGDSGWSQRAVEAEEVCGETGNVRSSHGGSADGVSFLARPGGSDVHAGSPDINAATIIGVAGLRVVDIGIGDGDRLFNTGRRKVARILVFVSGAYDDGDTAVVKLRMETPVNDVVAAFHPPSAYLFHGPVHSDRTAGSANYAHGNNGGITRPPYFSGDPVNPGDTVVR